MLRVSSSALGALFVAAACSGSRPARDLGPSILSAAPSASAAYASPAKYRYHPRSAGRLLAEHSLGSDRVLFAGQRGERWVVDSRTKITEAASELAPEELVAITARTPRGYTFLGRTGTAYESSEPLGPFESERTPTEPFARIRESGGVLLGVRRDGSLARSQDAGASWTTVGPRGVRFFDVAMTLDGNGLAVAVPEALHASRDFGVSWTEISTTSFGTEGLHTDGAGIWLSTILGARHFSPAAANPFPMDPSRLRSNSRSLTELPLGPSGSAAKTLRGAFISGEWLEVRLDQPTAPRLVRGALDGPFSASVLDAAKGCADVKLAGLGAVLYLVCARQKPTLAPLPVLIERSTDAGRTWSKEPYAPDVHWPQLTLAVAADGALVTSGVCTRALAGPGCRPAGIHRRTTSSADAGQRTVLEPVAAPALSGPALALVASLDGRRLYALGRRTKSDALAVFALREGSTTFEAHEIDAVRVGDDDDHGHGRPGELVVESAAAAEDGTVGFVVNRRGRRVALVVDETGRFLAASKSPTEAALLGVGGGRVFAVDPSSRESWESLDTGGTFVSLGKLPADPCPGARECPADVVCFAQGCIIADSLTRVGWGPGPRSVVLAPQAEQRAAGSRRVATPWSCSLEVGEWRRIPGALAIPGADHAAIGKKAWFLATYDPKSGAASVVSTAPGKSALEQAALLEPVAKPAEMATTVSVQIEGVAALRYPLPRGESSELASVEVAFSDLLAGRAGRGTIAHGGAFRPDDVAPGRPGVTLAKTALLSIASGGIYVRLHGGLSDNQATYFLDGRTVETLPGVQWPPSVAERGRTEMVHVGAAHVPLRFDGSIVVRASKGGTFDAHTAGWVRPSDFGLSQQTGVAYVGRDAGLLMTVGDADGLPRSSLAPFRAEGSVLGAEVLVPTQSHVGDPLRPCSAADRARTPRVVAPYRVGTRHPILVNEAMEPQRVLLTEDAVLHGTQDAPCVAVLEASLVVSEGSARAADERALLFPDAPERTFLFRAAASATPPGVEFRIMSCRPDPSAEVPPEVFKMDGTTGRP